MASVGELVAKMSLEGFDSVKRDLEQFSREMQKAGDSAVKTGDKISKAGKGLSSIGKSLTKSITVPLAGLALVSAKTASDFESSFAGVKKTVDELYDSNGNLSISYGDLEKGIRDMAKQLPASANEIANVVESAGQLGISTDNVLSFAKTMIDMGESTNMSSEEAATALAQLANITQMPQDKFENLGSVIVALGNNMATTEGDIVAMGLRLAGTGKQIGLSESQIMALSATMSALGINAEAGGGSMSRVLQKINTEVLSGGAGLSKFAKISGMSASEFEQAWKKDATVAIDAFVKGLGEVQKSGGDVTSILKDMGINSTQEIDTLLRLSGAGETLSEALDLAGVAWEENSALATEAGQRYETTESKMKIFKNRIDDIFITLGGPLLDALISTTDALQPLIEKVASLATKFAEADPETQRLILGIAGAVAVFPLLMSAIGNTLSVFGSFVSGGGKVLKFFTKGADDVSQFSKMLSSIKGVFTTVGGVFTSVGSLLLKGVTGIGSAIKGLFALIMAHPFVAIGVAVVALVTLIVLNWDTVKAKTLEIWGAIKEFLSGVWDGIKAVASSVWGSIAEFFSGAWDGIKAKTSEIWESITSFLTGIWDGIKNKATEIWTGVTEAVSSGWETVKTKTSEVWSSITDFVSTAWETIKNVVTVGIMLIAEVIRAGFTLITLPFQFIWQNCKDVIIEAWEAIKSAVSTAISAVANVISTGWNAVYTFTSSILQSVSSFISSIWNAITSYLSSVMSSIKTVVSTAWNAIKSVISTVVDAIKTKVSAVFDSVKSFVTKVWNDVKSVTTKVWDSIKSAVDSAVNKVKEVVTNVFNTVKSFVTSVWNAIKSAISSAVNAIKATVTSVFNQIKSVITTVLNAIKSVVTTVWNGIKSVTTSVWNGIKSAVSNAVNAVKSTVTSTFNAVKSTVSSVWNSIKTAITTPINSAKDAVRSAIEKIKGFMNFKWSLPKLKMPHFSMSGKFSLNPPSVPKLGVDWYATGGIATGASVVGIGEAGDEAIVPLSNKSRMRPFAEAVSNMMKEDDTSGTDVSLAGVTITGNTFNVRKESDIKEIAQELYKLEQRERRSKGRK